MFAGRAALQKVAVVARESNERKKAGRAPTSDRLRYDIDRGMGRDKVDFPDPAAAPLGTDGEAGDGTDGSARASVAAAWQAAWQAEMRRAYPPSSGSAPHFYVATTLLTVGLIVLFALAALTTAPS